MLDRASRYLPYTGGGWEGTFQEWDRTPVQNSDVIDMMKSSGSDVSASGALRVTLWFEGKTMIKWPSNQCVAT